jgi:hypothetical protein
VLCTVVCYIAEVQASFGVPGAWPSYNLAQDGRLEEGISLAEEGGQMRIATHHVLGSKKTDYRRLIEKVRNMATLTFGWHARLVLGRRELTTSPHAPSRNRTKLDRFPRISPAAQPLSTTTPPAPFAVMRTTYLSLVQLLCPCCT